MHVQEDPLFKQISKESIDIFIKFGKSTVCQLKFQQQSNTISGTGFFTFFNYFEHLGSPSTRITGLFTCNHVYPQSEDFPENFPSGLSIEFSGIDTLSEAITLNENNIIFKWTSKELDATFFEFSDHFLGDLQRNFLQILPVGHPRTNETVIFYQFPKQKLSLAIGKISQVQEDVSKIWHTAATDRGSSGAPIVNKDRYIVGIHFGSYNAKTKLGCASLLHDVVRCIRQERGTC